MAETATKSSTETVKKIQKWFFYLVLFIVGIFIPIVIWFGILLLNPLWFISPLLCCLSPFLNSFILNFSIGRAIDKSILLVSQMLPTIFIVWFFLYYGDSSASKKAQFISNGVAFGMLILSSFSAYFASANPLKSFLKNNR